MNTNLENEALPPKDTIKPKPQLREKALPPKDTIIRPKPFLKKINEMVKNYGVWALLFLFTQEIISLFLWNNENYKDFYYPLLNQIGLIILLLNIYIWRNKLNFCNYKKFALISMIFYYLTGVLAMIFKFELFIDYISYFLLGMTFSLIIFTIKRNQK